VPRARPAIARDHRASGDNASSSRTSSPAPRPPPAPPPAPPQTSPPAAAPDSTLDLHKGPQWTYSLSVYTYIAPDDREYVQPTLVVDRDWLHLEARYNYEGIDTGSVWAGYNFSFGDTVKLDLTPMVGFVFGDTTGVAPGYRANLTWRRFVLYTEGEYLFDSGGSSGDFFYSWSEFTYAPTDWLRAGIAAQRTKTRDDADFEFGPMIGVTFKRLSFTGYALFPDGGDPTYVMAVGFGF
jgi:hypothetical protein